MIVALVMDAYGWTVRSYLRDYDMRMICLVHMALMLPVKFICELPVFKEENFITGFRLRSHSVF